MGSPSRNLNLSSPSETKNHSPEKKVSAKTEGNNKKETKMEENVSGKQAIEAMRNLIDLLEANREKETKTEANVSVKDIVAAARNLIDSLEPTVGKERLESVRNEDIQKETNIESLPEGKERLEAVRNEDILDGHDGQKETNIESLPEGNVIGKNTLSASRNFIESVTRKQSPSAKRKLDLEFARQTKKMDMVGPSSQPKSNPHFGSPPHSERNPPPNGVKRAEMPRQDAVDLLFGSTRKRKGPSNVTDESKKLKRDETRLRIDPSPSHSEDSVVTSSNPWLRKRPIIQVTDPLSAFAVTVTAVALTDPVLKKFSIALMAFSALMYLLSIISNIMQIIGSYK